MASIISFEQAKFENEYHTDATPGYLGEAGFTGSKYAEGKLYGTALSKAIRDDLRKHLSVTKKSHVNVCKGGYRGITVTIKLERERYARTLAEALEAFEADRPSMGSYQFIEQADEDGNRLPTLRPDEYYSMGGEEQETVRERMYRAFYLRGVMTDRDVQDRTLYSQLLTNEGRQVLNTANAILSAYNHDASNSMVDYFDRHFYDSVYIRWI